MKYFVFIIIFFFHINILYCSDKVNSIYYNNNYWMFELFGNTLGLSFNYDGILFSDSLNNSEIRFRNGIGFSILAIHSPHSISYTYGKKHKFEIALGIILDYTGPKIKMDSADIKSTYYSAQVVKANGFLGYKFIKENGTYWRIGYTPFYAFDRIQKTYHWAGISYGF
jgi:hypothetical protein